MKKLAVLSTLFLLVVVYFGSAAPAPATGPTATPLPQDEAGWGTDSPGRFYSYTMDATYRIYVQLPAQYEDGDDFPVLYLLDGDWYFDGSHPRMPSPGVAGMVSDMIEQGKILPSILIGIGTDDRGTDFHVNYAGFHSFLKYELLPFIDATYHTTDERTLIGHSSAGHFTIIAAFWYETPFQHFIALSGCYTRVQGGTPIIHHLLQC